MVSLQPALSRILPPSNMTRMANLSTKSWLHSRASLHARNDSLFPIPRNNKKENYLPPTHHTKNNKKNQKTLLQTGQNLCALCHDPFPKTAKSRHQPVENGECLSCHNPHASNSKGLLLKPDGKLCFECHDGIEKELGAAKVKHQPVENGECSSCHKPHTSDQKKLLSKPDGKLCFECHE